MSSDILDSAASEVHGALRGILFDNIPSNTGTSSSSVEVTPCSRYRSELMPDVTRGTSCDFVPITKRTVCYIVCCIVFDDKQRVLLIQEAKNSCRGKWYLPAGRVERNETLGAAVQRETLEEAGLTFDPVSLIALETQGTYWFRFTFTGNITGGTVKTEADTESLQARWFSLDDVLHGKVDLRADDIINLIKIGWEYTEKSSEKQSIIVMPVPTSHDRMFLRYIIIDISETDQTTVLMSTTHHASLHLPVVQMDKGDKSIHGCLHRLLAAACGRKNNAINVTSFAMAGVEHDSGVDHSGVNHDGMCLTLVYHISRHGTPDGTSLTADYHWVPIKDSTISMVIRTRLERKQFVPILR